MPPAGHIELWRGSLSGREERNDDYSAVLANQERRTADGMRRADVRRRFVETRARLRIKLGEYLGKDPARIVLAVAEHGKPYLPEHPELSFNLSHSGEHLLLAVTTRSEIGADVEAVRSRRGLEGIAGKCFAKTELDHWRSLPKADQVGAFFRLWTAKEAFVKATGRGIALGLNNVVFDAGGGLKLLDIPRQFGLPDQWQVAAVEMAENLSAAVCLKHDEAPRIIVKEWTIPD